MVTLVDLAHFIMQNAFLPRPLFTLHFSLDYVTQIITLTQKMSQTVRNLDNRSQLLLCFG